MSDYPTFTFGLSMTDGFATINGAKNAYQDQDAARAARLVMMTAMGAEWTVTVHAYPAAPVAPFFADPR